MSLLSELNLYVASFLPRASWDWLEMFCGLWVLFGVLAQRANSPRFQRSSMKCPLAVATVIAGQIGIWVIGCVGFLVFLDGLLPAVAPPRTIVMVFLFGFGLVQLRSIHDAIADPRNPAE